MKNHKCDTCPGCGKHCPAKHPDCGYGRKYFARLQKKEQKHAWEEYAEREGLAWRLISAGKELKRLLREEKITETQAFAALDSEERKTLLELLEKLSRGGKYFRPAVSK